MILCAAVDLLQQHDARELVGQRDRAERQPVVDPLELQAPNGPPITKQRSRPLARRCSRKPAEADRVERLTVDVQQRHESSLRHARWSTARVLADLDQLEPRVAAEQLGVVRDVIDEGWPQTADGDDDDPHR